MDKADQKRYDRLYERWQKSETARKKINKPHDVAIAGYDYTVADDGAKWNKVTALGKRNAAAYQKAEADRKAWEDFMRGLLRGK